MSIQSFYLGLMFMMPTSADFLGKCEQLLIQIISLYHLLDFLFCILCLYYKVGFGEMTGNEGRKRERWGM